MCAQREGDLVSVPTLQLDLSSVILAPFVNISGNSADSWIGRGIAESLFVDLQHLNDYSITKTTAANQIDIATVERMLLDRSQRRGAGWLVSGSYQKLGEQLRITARILSVRDGSIRNVVKVDGSVSDIFSLQDEIAVAVTTGLLSLSSTPSTAEQVTRLPPTENVASGEFVSSPLSNPVGGGLIVGSPLFSASRSRAKRSAICSLEPNSKTERPRLTMSPKRRIRS